MNRNDYDYRDLARIRKEKFKKQTEFAKQLGVTSATASRLENGHITSFKLLVRACEVLGINYFEILTPPPSIMSAESERAGI